MTLYSSAELAALTFDSFRFSQGDVYTQTEIIKYIATNERERITAHVPKKWPDNVVSANREKKGLNPEVGVMGALVTEIAQSYFEHHPLSYRQITPEWKQWLSLPYARMHSA